MNMHVGAIAPVNHPRQLPIVSIGQSVTQLVSRPRTSEAYDNLLVAIHAVTRRRLDAIVPLVYQANLQGQIDEEDAAKLHEAAEMRRGVFAARHRVNTHKRPKPERPQHPRSRSRANRRVWSASGALPPTLRSLFTPGENAVAAVIRAEVRKRGSCTLPYAAIAKAAGLLSTTVVKRFVRIAKAHNLIAVTERKVAHNRNAPNVIVIASAEWLKWNEFADRSDRKGGGGTTVPPIQSKKIYKPATGPVGQVKGAYEEGSRGRGDANPTRRLPMWGIRAFPEG